MKEADGLRIAFRGDGKTYKVLLSDGHPSAGSPMARTPSWQCDLPTKLLGPEEKSEVTTLTFDAFLPSFGGRAASKPSEGEMSKYTFVPWDMRELGFMLSLRLSDGKPNPKETFGEGKFDFKLLVESIQAVSSRDQSDGKGVDSKRSGTAGKDGEL